MACPGIDPGLLGKKRSQQLDRGQWIPDPVGKRDRHFLQPGLGGRSPSPFLHPFPLRDVIEDQEGVQHLPSFVADRRCGDLSLQDVPIFSYDPPLSVAVMSLPGKSVEEDRRILTQKAISLSAQCLGSRETGQPFRSSAPERNLTGSIDGNDPFLNTREEV